MFEPILPMLAVIFFSLILIGLGIMTLLIFKRLPKPKHEAIQQNLVAPEQELIAEPVDLVNSTPLNLPSPLLQLSFQEFLDVQKYVEACQISTIPYLNEQLQLGVVDGVVLTINALRLRPSGVEMIFRASKDGQTLYAQGLAVLSRHGGSGRFLPLLKDAKTGKIIEQLKGTPMATTLSRLGALSAAVVGAAHIVAGADIAKRLKQVEEKLDLLLAFRQIDKVAALERIYTSAKELASGPMSPIKRWELWHLRGELRELRIAWRREWEHHLTQIKDPKPDNWFVKKFSQLPVTMVARTFLKKKQDTREAQITEKISEGQAKIAYIGYSFHLEQLLAVASGTEKEFMVTLADELQQLDSLARLLQEKSRLLTDMQGVEPVVKDLNEIVTQYRSLLPEKLLLS